MKKLSLGLSLVALFLTHIFLSGCNDDISVTVTISGLSAGQSLTVQLVKDNSGSSEASVTVSENSTRILTARHADVGQGYRIIISQQPSSDTCTVIDGARIALAAYDPPPVSIICSSTSYALGGTVSGLGTGESLVVVVNGSQRETLSSNGSFTLSSHVANGATYSVTSFTEPTTKGCTFTSNSGTPTADVSNISIACHKANFFFLSENFLGNFGTRAAALSHCQAQYDRLYTTSFTCSGGMAPFVTINADEEIRDMPSLYTFRQDAPFFGVKNPFQGANIKNHTKMADNWTDLLDGTITEPFQIDEDFYSYRTGSLSDGSISTSTCTNWTSANSREYGTIGSPRKSDSEWMESASQTHCGNYVPILCLCMQTEEDEEDTVTVGGTLSGLQAGTVTLSLNAGAQTKSLTANGSFTFATGLAVGDAYAVVVTSEPDYTDCTVTNGSGNATSNVTNITVTCETPSNFLFPTTTSYNGNLVNRATVDAYCSATKTASYATLPCAHVRAFISFDAADEIRDMPSLYSVDTDLSIIDAVDGLTVADSWADLLDGDIDNALTVNWWSGSGTDGGSSTPFNCANWTDASLSDVAMGEVVVGQSGQTNFLWTGDSSGACNAMHPVMCLCFQ